MDEVLHKNQFITHILQIVDSHKYKMTSQSSISCRTSSERSLTAPRFSSCCMARRSTLARSSFSSADMEADVSRYCRTCTNARMIEMLAATAIGLFSTLASMATPCSVKAKGGAEVFLFNAVTICDRMFSTSSAVNRNIKSEGKRSAFLFTAWLSALVSTWYNLARSKSSITFFTHSPTLYRSLQI